MEQTRPNMTNISGKLIALMARSGLNTTQLAKETKIPQATLHKIITNESQKPRAATLKKLADYFNIDIQDLILSAEEIYAVEKRSVLPVIKWAEINDWLNEGSFNTKRFITISRHVSKTAFATISTDSIIPQFKNGATLIFEPNLIPKDGSIVLLKLHQHEDILLRQLIIDVQQKFIKPLNPDLAARISPIDSKDKILATLIQVIIDYENN